MIQSIYLFPMRQNMRRMLPLLCAAALLSGCAARSEPTIQTFFAMDTTMSVTAYAEDPTDALVAAQQAVNRLDALWSRTRPDSDIARLNAAAGTGAVAVDGDTAALLTTANAAAEESGLAFDPVLCPVMDAWGFGSTESETTAVHRVPAQAELDELLPLTRDLPLVDGDTAALALPGQAVDLGGIAKGAAAAYVVDALTQNGVESAIIALGGNITALGVRPDGHPFRVYVRDPRGEGEDYLCLIALPDGRTCSTSGGYERCFVADGVTYHHIIDPANGYPAQSGLLSVTVVADDPALADAWSTALFVLGPDEAIRRWKSGQGTVAGMDLILVTDAGHVYVTQGLEEGLETLGEEAGYTYEIVRR